MSHPVPLFLFPSFLHLSFALTVINLFGAFNFHLCFGQINLGTFCVALITRCSGLSGFSIALSSSILNSSSLGKLCSPWFRLSMLPFQWSEFVGSKILSDVLTTSHSTGGASILFIRQTFHPWICPSVRSCADNAGSNGDRSDNLYTGAPSCWKLDQDASTILSVSEWYSMAAVCWYSVWDSFSVRCLF